MLKSMRYVLLILVLMLPSVHLLAQDATPAATPEATQAVLPDLGGREINIAVENAYPPYNAKDANGRTYGWDYDTLRDICGVLNCVPKFDEMAWDGMLLAVSQGSVDIAADGITSTPERAQTVDFSSLYQAYDETLMVRADETRFSTVDELKKVPNFLVGTQVGTTNEQTSHQIFGADHTKSYQLFPQAVQALLNGDVDAVEIDRPAGVGEIATTPGLKLLSINIKHEGLAFAFPKGSDLVAPVDAAMAYLESSGRWDQLYARWFLPSLANADGSKLAITVAVPPLDPPYSFQKDGAGVGWYYDIVNSACKLLLCDPTFKVMNWSQAQDGLKAGTVDLTFQGTQFVFAPNSKIASAFNLATEQEVSNYTWGDMFKQWFESAQ